MTFDEGMAVRNGEKLNIQCLISENYRENKEKKQYNYHYHKYIEFLYVYDGEIDIFIGKECIRCKKNNLFVIYANEPHDFYNITNNKYYVIKFLPEILRVAEQTIKEFEYIFNFNLGTHPRIIDDANGKIKNLFEDAYKHFTENRYANELFIRSDIIRICAETVAFWHTTKEIVPISNATSHENLILIQKVIEYTKENNGALKTHEAAQMCNMSDGHFSRIFKSVMNMSFTQYTKSIKTEEAERLLRCTDKTITEIAQIINYASTSHFIEDFRKEKGISPKQYRKMNYS